MKVRQGTSRPRNLYLQQEEGPLKTDPYIGVMETPGLAALVTEAINCSGLISAVEFEVRIHELHRRG